MENSTEITQQIKNSNFTPGYLSEENKNINEESYIHTYVHCSIIYNSQDMEETRMPINGHEWTKNMLHI